MASKQFFVALALASFVAAGLALTLGMNSLLILLGRAF